MTYTEIVKKLIGPVNPIGKSEVDKERLQNLKNLCELANDLVSIIDNVAYENRDAQEASVREAADYASSYLKDYIGID